MKTKKCRTYNSLLKHIEKGLPAILEYYNYNSNPLNDKTIVYLKDGTNLILSTTEFERIKSHLVQIDF